MTAVTHLDIICYYPNIVGYLRFALTLWSVAYAFDTQENSWIKFAVLYSTSQILDAIDGRLARKFD